MHSYDSYHIYIAIHSSFLQAVYPVGVTDLRPYFTRIIGHNSVNGHRISTKLGTVIRLNEPFKCAKLHPDWHTHSCFIADFAKCAKRSRRKKRRKNPKLWPLVSGKRLERFSSNLECRLPYLADNSVANLVSIELGVTELQRCENPIFFLPISILTAWCANFLGRTTHGSVS